MNKVAAIAAKQIRNDIPEFRVGDTVRVDYKIIGSVENVEMRRRYAVLNLERIGGGA